MVFSSIVFIYVFLPLTLGLYYLIPRRFLSARNVLLFFMSLLFYAWGEPKYVLLMLASILMNWMFGLGVGRLRFKAAAKLLLAAAIAGNLAVLFVFKYLAFTVSNLNRFWNLDLKVPSVALPIGISFFTFQAMSYVIDVYRGHGQAQKNLINVGLYIAFFPQLVAGPIVRYETIAEQIRHRRESLSMFAEGCEEFVRGLGKKVLLANSMAIVCDRAFALSQSGQLSTAFAWIGSAAYTFQIFYDFSGYSEMAIGMGKMFGFTFLPNFNYPYVSRSISDFWRRWHMSLGSWFRDYVYFPLGGSRTATRSRAYFNLFVVWLLTGIWHGANWTFICWGMLYFLLIAAEKFTGFEKTAFCRSRAAAPQILSRAYTMLFVMIGFVLFRSPSLSSAYSYLRVMFHAGTNAPWTDYLAPFYLINYRAYFGACLLCAVPFSRWLSKRFPRAASLRFLFYAVVFAASMAAIVKSAYNPFIYFNF